MSKKQDYLFLLVLWLGLGCAAQAQSQAPQTTELRLNTAAIELTPEAQENAQLDAIAQERVQIEQTYLAQQKTCYQKFRTTHCLDTLKKSYRNDSKRLQQQEISITDIQRQRKAAIKKAQVARNLVDVQQRKENSTPSTHLDATLPAHPLPEKASTLNRSALPGRDLKPSPMVAPTAQTAKTPQQIEENIQKYQKKQRQAVAHRANKQSAERSKAAPLAEVE